MTGVDDTLGSAGFATINGTNGTGPQPASASAVVTGSNSVEINSLSRLSQSALQTFYQSEKETTKEGEEPEESRPGEEATGSQVLGAQARRRKPLFTDEEEEDEDEGEEEDIAP
jgi:hypothetical protein